MAPDPQRDLLRAALELRRRGFVPIPLRYRQKQPAVDGWTEYQATEECLRKDFGNGPVNVGLLLGTPSGNLVDVDLDDPIACQLAPLILPPTDLCHGRAGAPGSHRWYRASDLPTERFLDPTDRSVLVEIRSTGAQTMVPPSIHPVGDPLEWEKDAEPAHLEGSLLRSGVARLSAATALARRWPRGSRHDAAMALGGGLIRAGWRTEEAGEFVAVVARGAGDEEWRERTRDVRTTAQRLASGKTATGFPKLADLIPEAVLRVSAEWLGITWENEPKAPPRKAGGAIPVVVRASEVAPEAVEYLSVGRLALGKITVLEGDPDAGKSTITCDIAARITTGRPLFGDCGDQPSEPADVVFVCCEDGLADTVVPRLDAAGADRSRVHVIPVMREARGGERLPQIPGDLPEIRAEIEKCQARLLVIDPIAAYVGEKVDTHRDASIRRALAPLATLAEQTRAAVLAVRHLTKGEKGKSIYAGQGSIAIIAQARFGLIVGHDPDEPDTRILATSKCNVTSKPASLRFRIEAAEGHEGQRWECGRIAWLGECDATGDDLVAPAGDEGRASRLREAEEWLLEELAGGPRQSEGDLFPAAEKHGISRTTLRRAKRTLGLPDGKKRIEGSIRTFWYLYKHVREFHAKPEQPDQKAGGGQDEQVDPVDKAPFGETEDS